MAAAGPDSVLPPASARRMEDLLHLLRQARTVCEGLLDELREHEQVIHQLVTRISPNREEGDGDAGQ